MHFCSEVSTSTLHFSTFEQVVLPGDTALNQCMYNLNYYYYHSVHSHSDRRGSVVVSMPAYHAAQSPLGPGVLHLTLNIGDCVSFGGDTKSRRSVAEISSGD